MKRSSLLLLFTFFISCHAVANGQFKDYRVEDRPFIVEQAAYNTKWGYHGEFRRSKIHQPCDQVDNANHPNLLVAVVWKKPSLHWS